MHSIGETERLKSIEIVRVRTENETEWEEELGKKLLRHKGICK